MVTVWGTKNSKDSIKYIFIIFNIIDEIVFYFNESYIYRNPPGYPDRAKFFFWKIYLNPDSQDPDYIFRSNIWLYLKIFPLIA